MDTDKLISRCAVLVPLAHVSACGMYIAGYSLGFGGQVAGMFTASDFLTVTIQHLASVYISGLGLPMIILIARQRSGVTYAADRISLETNPEIKARMTTRLEYIQKTLLFVLVGISIVSLVMLLLQIWSGTLPFYRAFLLFIWVGILPFWWRIFQRFGIHGLSAEAVWICATFALSVVTMGLEHGDRDRRLTYADLVAGRMKCKENVILRSIGERFITVTADNVRHIVSDECVEFAKFEKAPVARSDAIGPLIANRLRKIRDTSTIKAGVKQEPSTPGSGAPDAGAVTNQGSPQTQASAQRKPAAN